MFFNNPIHDVALIILAAGGSRRLGRPKQLERINDLPLLAHIIKVTHEAGFANIVVITGARRDRIEEMLEDLLVPLKVVYNRAWQRGMSSSIHVGLRHCQNHLPDIKGAMILVCDQPALNPQVLKRVYTAFDPTKHPIVRCRYREGFGPPVCFGSTLFDELLKLEGDIGARSVIKKHLDKCINIDFPEGDWDIDEESDLVPV